jgi:hypothetical protein
MRSKPEFNYPAFMEAEQSLRLNGWDVYNPAQMDLDAGDIDGVGDLAMSIEEQNDHASAPENARRYAWRDCMILIGTLRAEDGDAIVMLPDWEESTGAVAEHAIARWVGLDIFTLDEALERGSIA